VAFRVFAFPPSVSYTSGILRSSSWAEASARIIRTFAIRRLIFMLLRTLQPLDRSLDFADTPAETSADAAKSYWHSHSNVI
jgi:hypothetical protein